MLRGINVSGQKKVKMDDLRAIYESLGFRNIITYIQSGNVIFEYQNINKTELKVKIEKSIEKNYAFHVSVEIRTERELENILNNNPFGYINLTKEGTKYLVTFLSSIPSKSKVSEIQQFVIAPEKLIIHSQEAYLYCPHGYGKTKLSNNFLENKLGIEATTRNWKTVNKLYELTK
jgi:uncharacterized protein (DUF1697 family)